MSSADDNRPALAGSAKTLQVLLVILCGGLIAYLARSVLIPISFSLLISFLVYPVVTVLEKKGLSRTSAILLTMALATLILVGLIALIIYFAVGFISDWQNLYTRIVLGLQTLSGYILDQFNVDEQVQKQWLNNLSGNLFPQLLNLIKSATESIYLALLYLVLIPLMAVLTLFYRHNLFAALTHLFPDQNKNTLKEILHDTIHAYFRFIRGMLIVYLIVGVLNSAGLWLLGIPHAALFGFLASVLTFIPYVGIMIASLLPISIAWVTYGTWWYPAGVIAVFAVVQYLEANVIFPFAVSNQLKLNALSILVAILVGGLLWGTAGMILFIPFTSILKLIADRTTKLTAISLLLGK